jgi:hypothetical protein
MLRIRIQYCKNKKIGQIMIIKEFSIYTSNTWMILHYYGILMELNKRFVS